jgi:hypothetical protein
MRLGVDPFIEKSRRRDSRRHSGPFETAMHRRVKSHRQDAGKGWKIDLRVVTKTYCKPQELFFLIRCEDLA